MSRRSFLEVGSLGALGLSLPGFLAARASAAPAAAKGKTEDVNCIFVWSLGGVSHHDTLDPKPEAPAAVKGEFQAIDTAVPGVKFADVCPNLAKELKRFSVLRGWNPQNGSHGAADHYVMSGRMITPAMIYPCFGSVISQQKGFKSPLPPFVQLGNYVDRSFHGGLAGILGQEFNAFEMHEDPNAANFTVRDITPPRGIEMKRVDRRRKMLSQIDALQRKVDMQPSAFSSLDEHYKTALNMVTAPETKRAFSLDKEDPKLRDRYGRNRFGQSLLLARRLIESGVRFVTVSDPAWDTHADNFRSLKNSRMPPVDQGLPQLIIDLEERGLLKNTLVIWASDFGRTPNINSASGRDHWASAGFIAAAGAGVPGGLVLGATDDEGGRPIRDEYFTEDFATTMYHKLGLPTDLIVQAPDGRPIRLVEGRTIREWC